MYKTLLTLLKLSVCSRSNRISVKPELLTCFNIQTSLWVCTKHTKASQMCLRTKDRSVCVGVSAAVPPELVEAVHHSVVCQGPLAGISWPPTHLHGLDNDTTQMDLETFDSTAGKQSCGKAEWGICEAQEWMGQNLEGVHYFDRVQNTRNRRADLKRCDHWPVKYPLCSLQQRGG